MDIDDIRILVVEDQAEIGHILKLSIQEINRHYVVEVVLDAFEALDALREAPFDLVVTDYMMPDMDGLELLESIRNLSPDTQVIVISALPLNIVKPLINQAGVEFFLSKPFAGKDIYRVVGKALTKVKEIRQQQRNNSAVISSNISDSVYNQLSELLRYTNALCCFIVDSTGHLVAQVGDDRQTSLPALASLIAANATTGMRISKLLNNPTPFQNTLHEGPLHNVAVYALTSGVFLVVIFNRQVKIGMIQHYARQTVTSLADLLES